MRSHRWGWGGPASTCGGFWGMQSPGVSTYDAHPGHEEQHGSQGQAHAVVAHSVEDGAEFLLAYAAEHPAADALRGGGEQMGPGPEPPPAPNSGLCQVDQLLISTRLFLCPCLVLWVIVFLCIWCSLRGDPRSSAGSWCPPTA